ncbi:MAG: BlaI/MecI/CopY family transcriptional regulator [Pseudomonadota bacterium]
MRQKRKPDLLTEVELEFMSALWVVGEGSVREVLDQLAPRRKLAYTSAATILKILAEKGFANAQKRGKTLIYTPAIAKHAYQTRSLQNLSAKLFDNTPATLVARLVDDAGLSQESLEEIRAVLERRLGDGADEGPD